MRKKRESGVAEVGWGGSVCRSLRQKVSLLREDWCGGDKGRLAF